jgi:hypothetical protein
MGMYAGAVILAKTMDKTYTGMKEKAGGIGKPEFRLREAILIHQLFFHVLTMLIAAPLVPGTILLPVGILITGWTAETKTHWICPDIVCHDLVFQPFKRSDVIPQGLFIAGAGIIICSLTTQSYVIDTYAIHAASGLAAVGTLRSLAGFGFPLFAPAMYKSLGYGKGNTVLFSVAVAIGCPA